MTNTQPEWAARFWSKVQIGAPDACWPWTGAKRDGYGMFKANGRNHGAHRIALTLQGVEVPDVAVVCHRCDNPPCVNPAHLFVGTRADNNADMFAKRRNMLPPTSKLSPELAAEIRAEVARRLAEGRPYYGAKDLARRYGVTHISIRAVVNNRTWRQTNA